jgi:hypothetical protein
MNIAKLSSIHRIITASQGAQTGLRQLSMRKRSLLSSKQDMRKSNLELNKSYTMSYGCLTSPIARVNGTKYLISVFLSRNSSLRSSSKTFNKRVKYLLSREKISGVSFAIQASRDKLCP